MEKPNGIKEITIDYIIAYCEQEDGRIEWLNNYVNEGIIDSKSKERRNATFYEIRSAFINKYFPSMFSGTPSMRKRINQAYEARQQRKSGGEQPQGSFNQ